MNTHKVTEIFIGNGDALAANNAVYAPASVTGLGIYGQDGTSFLAVEGAVSTITTEPSLFIVNKLANGELKKSFEIKGTSITAWKGISYAPARRNVWSIGYHRASLASQSPTGVAITAGGDIKVNNSTNYNFTIRFKNDKIFYSERPEVLNVNFTSSATATQLSIATQITSSINNSAFGTGANAQIQAVTIGDGTGVYGLTGAANYGVEIWALDINQLFNTSYKPNYVYFSVQVDDSTGFESTTECVELQSSDPGSGTYNDVYCKENFNYQYEGVLNRVKFPIPTLAYLTVAAGTLSGTLAAFTVTGTISEDQVTFSAAANTQLPAGSKVVLNGAAYEIKYYVSTTVAVLTTVTSAALAADIVAARAWYDMYAIEVTDVVTTPGANVGQFAKKVLLIASPAINAGATAMTTQGTESSSVETTLNTWMTSTPLAPAVLAL